MAYISNWNVKQCNSSPFDDLKAEEYSEQQPKVLNEALPFDASQALLCSIPDKVPQELYHYGLPQLRNQDHPQGELKHHLRRFFVKMKKANVINSSLVNVPKESGLLTR